ncbi:hypothetical protein Sjap_021974 [Stephania japonica]|uniref:Uncharacterized protein n=1 Tax=Stephania japonica TaxID=461633 RepID=A0AAP0HTA6_9MAGN
MAEYAIGAGEMVNRLLTLVVGEIGLVVGVKDEVKKLGTVLRGIQAVLQDAQKKQVEQHAVRHWLRQLKEVAYDAEDVLDDVAYKELKYTLNNDNNKVPRWLNPKLLIARGKTAHKIKAINKRLDDIYKNATMQHQLVPLESNPQSGSPGYGDVDRETYSHMKEPIVLGREDDKKTIIQKLINDWSSSSSSSTDDHQQNTRNVDIIAPPVISIVGHGGLGKTTLARLVYNDDAVTKHFELRVWICVSTHFRSTYLFYQFLQQVDQSNTLPETSSKQVLLAAIETQLRKEELLGKKLLLVLDDDWNEDLTKWEDFVLPLGRSVSSGSKIIVTSRDRKVASVTGSQMHELKGLSDEACWGLIESQALKGGGPFKTSDELVHFGKKISIKCHGLPLAAKVLGGLLKSKRGEREWLEVLNDKIWTLNKKDPIKNVLKLSYDNLSPALQACFSYCAIFPKDDWIETRLLVQLWMAQGLLEAPKQELLKASRSQREPTLEDAGMICFDTLYSKSLFQEAEMNTYGEVTRCKMHHHLHDLAQSIMDSECQVLGESSVRSTDLSECRHVSMISLSALEDLHHEAKKVRTIFGWESTSKELVDGRTLQVLRSSALFKFESLRVLDLRGFRGSDFSSFSCKYFKHLRYLDLSSTNIKSLSEWVTGLYHLQTLKLINVMSFELPEDLMKLKKLRHLFIDDHKKWKKMPQALCKLHQLQTLPLFVVCQEESGCGISMMKDLNDFRGTLNIHRLSLVKKANLAEEGILCEKSSLRKLRLHWDRDSSVGDDGDELLVLEVLQP